MKKCPYCGKENPDDAVVCAIDRTPLDNAPPEKIYWKNLLPVFAVFSETKIPVSLIILSYIFFLMGAGGLAYVIFFLCVFPFFVGFDGINGGISFYIIILGVVGIFLHLFQEV